MTKTTAQYSYNTKTNERLLLDEIKENKEISKNVMFICYKVTTMFAFPESNPWPQSWRNIKKIFFNILMLWGIYQS